MSNCIFCKIAAGELPCYKVWEDEANLAFLDIRPIKTGHTLVVPKRHYPHLFEMESEDYQKLAQAVRQVAEILKKAFNPRSGKIGEVVYGIDVDHAHIHLVPIDQAGDLSLGKARPASEEELRLTSEKIKETSLKRV